MNFRAGKLHPIIGTCAAAYNEQASSRAAHPLRSGGYKLTEVRRQLQIYLGDLDLIAGFPFHAALTGVNPRTHCIDTAEDKAICLRNIPIQLAELLGYCWVPAVNALDGDGVCAEAIGVILPNQTRLIEESIAECERAHQRIQHSYGAEVKKIKDNASELTELVLGLLHSLDMLLNHIERHSSYQS